MTNNIPGGTFLGSFGGFSVVLVRKGDKYGRDNCVTHTEDEPLVEFYDASVTGKGFSTVGQFVARYYRRTLGQPTGQGLCLDGGVPEWQIAGVDLDAALTAVGVALGE
jgi:hypothetical protein